MKALANIDRRLGPRSEEVVKRMTVASLASVRRKRLQFLESKPVCSECGAKFHHFSKTMLCTSCRVRKNKENFLSRNPGYNARQYQKNKKRELTRQRRYYLINRDKINLCLRIKYQRGRTNYEGSLRFKLGRLERDVRAAGL